MVKKQKKLWLIFIYLIIIAFVIVAVCFIFFPAVTTYSENIKCFDCTSFALPLDEKGYRDMDTVDTYFEISVTRHWNIVTDISGFIEVDGKKYDLALWQKSGENYLCFSQEENAVSGIVRETAAFNSDFSAIRIMYNDGKFDENVKELWFGPAESADELLKVMEYFDLNYNDE